MPPKKENDTFEHFPINIFSASLRKCNNRIYERYNTMPPDNSSIMIPIDVAKWASAAAGAAIVAISTVFYRLTHDHTQHWKACYDAKATEAQEKGERISELETRSLEIASRHVADFRKLASSEIEILESKLTELRKELEEKNLLIKNLSEEKDKNYRKISLNKDVKTKIEEKITAYEETMTELIERDNTADMLIKAVDKQLFTETSLKSLIAHLEGKLKKIDRNSMNEFLGHIRKEADAKAVAKAAQYNEIRRRKTVTLQRSHQLTMAMKRRLDE